MFNAFKFASKVSDLGARTVTSSGSRLAVRSPWAGRSLSRIVLADLAGLESAEVSRTDAMSVPAIARGRSLIVGSISNLPLIELDGEERVETSPWLVRTDTAVAPSQRMLWTLDDLIFSGLSLWAVTRDDDGQITDAARVPPEWWEITPDLEVLVNGVPAGEGEVILFEGPQDGLLEIARRTTRAAIDMDTAWSERVRSPIPTMELHSTDGQFDLDEAEADELVDVWDEARRNGGTGYTPAGIELRVHGQASADLFVNGRNALRLDVANFLAVPANLLEGSTSTASLTYSTQEGRRNEFADYSLSYWARPIEARLSQDDVVAPGRSVAFDVKWLSTSTQPDQGPTRED